VLIRLGVCCGHRAASRWIERVGGARTASAARVRAARGAPVIRGYSLGVRSVQVLGSVWGRALQLSCALWFLAESFVGLALMFF
jgi:hypothetical protein